jgi:uncharacterized protein (DUF983 family)
MTDSLWRKRQELSTPCYMKEDSNEEEDNLCPTCNSGYLYTKPHWSYWMCDLCGQRKKQVSHDE